MQENNLRRILILATLLLGTTMSAQADRYADCDQWDDLDLQVRSCTEIVQHGSHETKAARYKAHINRGHTYLLREEPALALADFERAIKLNETSALAFGLRGLAHADMGQKIKLSLISRRPSHWILLSQKPTTIEAIYTPNWANMIRRLLI